MERVLWASLASARKLSGLGVDRGIFPGRAGRSQQPGVYPHRRHVKDEHS
jgi:hypothetical protein